jgi:alpha-mannosidase
MYHFKESTVAETVRIYKEQYLIEFYHNVNWQNLGYMLRSSFDLNIDATEAIADIQFGELSRSRLEDTSVRKAQIEVPAQNWISVSDGTHGAALLNSGKYGYYIKGSTLDINLLRSTNHPCENGDIGLTSYQYSLYLHDGDTNQVDIKAKEINTFYQGLTNNVITDKLFDIENPVIHYSTVKQASDCDGIIIRLYNNSGKETLSKLFLNDYMYEITETNMIEEQIFNLGTSDVINLSFTPYEVKTFRLVKKDTKG